MTIKNYIIILVFSLLLVGCEKSETVNNPEGENETANCICSDIEESEIANGSDLHDYRVLGVLYAKNSTLKYVSRKGGGKRWYADSEYEYDDFGRISKVSRMYDTGKEKGIISYSIYAYNTNNQLEKITEHNVNGGYIVFSNYSYDKDGNKLKTLIEYSQMERKDSILYFYEDNSLKREEQYDGGLFNNGLKAYIEYKYDNQGNLITEIIYSGVNNCPFRLSKHVYKNGLNVKTEVFTYYNIIEKTKLREVRRYYDQNGNLIYLESEELSFLSSSSSYTMKYEY